MNDQRLRFVNNRTPTTLLRRRIPCLRDHYSPYRRRPARRHRLAHRGWHSCSCPVADERAHSDQVLTDERTAADKRLKSQQEHSDRQFYAAQTRSQQTEQYTEAYAVQVTVGEITTVPGPPNEHGDPGADATKRLAALVVNRGRCAITRVTAQFSPDGKSLTSPSRVVRIPASFEKLPQELRGDFGPLQDKRGHGDRLTPWDAGMRFESGDVGLRHLAGPYFVVRWVDRWGTHWEHKQGVVRYITDGEAWST